MPTILNVQSSPNLNSSASRAVSQSFIDAYLTSHPGTEVINIDLATNPPAHIGPDHLLAFFAPSDAHGPESVAALAVSDQYIAQLTSADVLVLGTPMHNFGIASTMKSWVDNILRAGKTFKYTENGPVGLLSGKKVVIAVGSGGVYSDGIMKNFEHCGNYLRDIFSFIGLTDITILRAEGLAISPEAAQQGLAAGQADAERIAQ